MSHVIAAETLVRGALCIALQRGRVVSYFSTSCTDLPP
jgi:hypothetical protein